MNKIQQRILVRNWLLGYVWMEKSDAEKAAKVDCILAQDDWEFIDAVADQFAGAQFEPGPEAFAEGVGYALSALYECHDGPHTSDCPSRAYEIDAAIKKQKRDDDVAAGNFRTVRVLIPASHGEGQEQLGDSFILTLDEIAGWTPMQDDWVLDIL